MGYHRLSGLIMTGSPSTRPLVVTPLTFPSPPSFLFGLPIPLGFDTLSFNFDIPVFPTIEFEFFLSCTPLTTGETSAVPAAAFPAEPPVDVTPFTSATAPDAAPPFFFTPTPPAPFGSPLPTPSFFFAGLGFAVLPSPIFPVAGRRGLP